MARPIVWLPRLAEITRSVVGSSSSHFSRSDLERIFQVQPKTAGRLMGLLPRSDALGSSHLVEKVELVKFLERVRGSKDPHALLEKIRVEGPRVNRRRKIPAFRRDDGLLVPKSPPAPEAVVLTRGKIEIRFETAEEFMTAMLWAVVVKFGDDEDGFVRDYCVEQVKPAASRDLNEAVEMIRKSERDFDAWVAAKRDGRGSAEPIPCAGVPLQTSSSKTA